MNDAIRTAVRRYVVGFGLSLVCTLVAFWLVIQHVNSNHVWPTHDFIVPTIICLAIAQLMTQLFFFLHLGRESRPRWNVVVFLFMLLVLVIVVFGSLWIMQNLNYHTMSPNEIKAYLHDHPGSF